MGNDTVVAFDSRLRRLSSFDNRGNFLRSWSIASDSLRFPRPRGTLNDGSVVIIVDADPRHEVLRSELVARFPLTVTVLRDDSRNYEVVADLVYSSQYYQPPTDGQRVVQLPVLFGYDLHVEAGRERVWWGYTGSGQLTVAGPGGRREFELPVVARDEVTAADRSQEVERVLMGESGPGAEQARSLLRDAPANRHFPIFRALIVDENDRAWIQHREGPEELWVVLDPQTGVLGTVDLPTRFRPMWISDSVIAGVLLDELGVETVAVLAWEPATALSAKAGETRGQPSK